MAAALLLAVAPLAAQRKPDHVPQRPALPTDRDSNSANAYYFYGVSVLERDPEKAAAAFYWATRLDPTSAPALYGRHAALLLSLPEPLLTAYLTRQRGALQKPILRTADSLAYLALIKSPFLDRRIYGVLLSTWVARETGGTTDIRELGMYDRRFTAWAAYARGEFPMAVSVYRENIKRHPDDPDLRFLLALSYLGLGRPDSARFAVQEALGLERTADRDTPGIGWSSHAFEEYSVGTLFEMAGERDSAQAAFQRALLDDVAFHPAHYHLARMRLAAQDTVGALDEYNQAVTLAPGDAGYLSELGILLLQAGHVDSATAVLLRVTELEPYYAFPHYPLGVVYEHSGFSEEATQHYRAFLRLAPRAMAAAITAARERLAALQAKPPAP